MDAICVFLSSFRAAKGTTCHSRAPAGCEPWATDGISLCLYCTMPMLCLRASQLYKPKQTFSFIDSVWLIFLNFCVCMCVLCFAWPPLTTANKHSCRGSESFEARSLRLFFSQSQLDSGHTSILQSSLVFVTSGHWYDDSYLWLPALPVFSNLYCPHQILGKWIAHCLSCHLFVIMKSNSFLCEEKKMRQGSLAWEQLQSVCSRQNRLLKLPTTF